MRYVLALACLCAPTAASADAVMWEWNDATVLRPASDLSFGACAMAVTFHGAIAEIELRQQIRNAGTSALAGAFETELPRAAELIGAALDRSAAIGVAVNSPVEPVTSVATLGADPLLVTRVGANEDGARVRYRAVLQPVAGGHVVTLALRWTQLAAIHDSALHLKLLGRADAWSCAVTVAAQPGPGARVAQLPAPFALAADDQLVDVPLVIAGTAPIAWQQSVALGDGQVAHAVTVIAPPARAATARRALFVIDTSRSMDLVGHATVQRVVAALVGALPAGSEVEAITFDRTAERLLHGWKPAAATLFDEVLEHRGTRNGSDLVGALALAKTALAEAGGPRGEPMVIVISDGVLGEIAPALLAAPLGDRTDAVDVHAIVLDPHALAAPDDNALHGLVALYGGTYVEVASDELDQTIGNSAADWVRSAWQRLAAPRSGFELPTELGAGAGFVLTAIGDHAGKVALTARGGDATVAIHAAELPTAPLAQLALAATDDEHFGEGATGEQLRARLTTRHPAVDDEHDLAILTTLGRVAGQRQQMISGGGPYSRMVVEPDPRLTAPQIQIGTVSVQGGSALDKGIIHRLLADQLQPRSYSCYARELGRLITVEGTATFHVELGRGEVMRVAVTGFEGSPEFSACLTDAAYGLGPPQPTLGYNTDEQTAVNYALTFRVRDKQPVVSDSDVGVSEKTTSGRPHLRVDPSTPLGGLTP